MSEQSDQDCPRCGHYMLVEDCLEIYCGQGWIDLYEADSDPLWYSPGDTEMCRECDGKGHVEWCPECGYNVPGYEVEKVET